MPTTDRILIISNILYSLVLRFYEEHTLFYLSVQLEVLFFLFIYFFNITWRVVNGFMIHHKYVQMDKKRLRKLGMLSIQGDTPSTCFVL